MQCSKRCSDDEVRCCPRALGHVECDGFVFNVKFYTSVEFGLQGWVACDGLFHGDKELINRRFHSYNYIRYSRNKRRKNVYLYDAVLQIAIGIPFTLDPFDPNSKICYGRTFFLCGEMVIDRRLHQILGLAVKVGKVDCTILYILVRYLYWNGNKVLMPHLRSCESVFFMLLIES